MLPVDRRTFLGSTLGGLAALLSRTAAHAGDSAKDDSTVDRSVRSHAAGPAEPESLFLTWQRDPTRTITIQWIGPEEADRTTVHYAPLASQEWRTTEVQIKPYPGTELKVHRCELAGLSPGTEYEFRIGERGDVHRFRTMPSKATDTIQFVSGGDAGTGSHAIGTNVLAARQDPYFALIGGDLA